jgi:hypothetical protein
VKVAKVEDGWWLHSDRIGNRLELRHGCFGMSMVEIVKDKMVTIIGGEGSTAWCGCLPWVVVAMKVE